MALRALFHAKRWLWHLPALPVLPSKPLWSGDKSWLRLPARCFVAASDSESQTASQNPAITFQRQTRTGLCPKCVSYKSVQRKRIPREDCGMGTREEPSRLSGQPWCHKNICLKPQYRGFMPNWCLFVLRMVRRVGVLPAGQGFCLKSNLWCACCAGFCFPQVRMCLGWCSGLGVLLVQQSLQTAGLNSRQGGRKEGERLACSCPEGKHKSSELQCNAMLAPSAPTASRAMSQIFTYVIVPLSSIVAKETQILLLTCGELLMY